MAPNWGSFDESFARESVRMGVVHEWFGKGRDGGALPLLVHLAEQHVGTVGVWIGRGCWPYLRRLSHGLAARSIFVDPSTSAERAWAVGLCLRNPQVGVIVADGSGLKLPATRRLQLAVRASRALLLLVRPERERSELSAAAVRWRVGPVPSPTSSPRWSVELLRCKGLRPASLPQRWTVEERHGAGLVLVPADAGDRSSPEIPDAPALRLKLA